MLGSAFAAHIKGAGSMGRSSLDVRDIQAIHATVARSGARLVVNCAAHTNVDLAEREGDDAWQVNALLPGILGSACRRAGAMLVHFSSTGAYGDWKQDPYEEEDPQQPTTVHHRSKVAGEVAVRESGCEHLIIRTGWLFGGAPGQTKNFVWNRLVEAANCREMKSDITQYGNPTAISDVVEQTLTIFESGYRGTINLVSQGRASRMDYVRRIVSAAGLDCVVSASDRPFERAARVSPNETAVNRRLQQLGLDQMPSWEVAVDRYVEGLKQSSDWQRLKVRA